MADVNTAGNAEVEPQQTEQDTQVAIPAPDTPKPGEAHPQEQATQNADPTEEEIQKAEQRASDKQAYLEKLQTDLSDMDRKINEQRDNLKMASQQPQVNQEQGEGQNLPDAHNQAAKDLGISGEQFIELLRNDPDKALSAVIEAANKGAEERILGKIPQQMERHRIETETRSKLQGIHQELGEEGFQDFRQLVTNYQQQGFTPTPEQAVNELMYGSPDIQRKLMEYGKIHLQQQEQAQGGEAQAVQPQASGFRMAPGGGNQTQPVQQQSGSENRSLLAQAGWNVS